MKLLYVSTHQIHNLTPLFREMTKQNKIDFKVVYWQKIPSVHYDLEFNTKIDFSIDQFSNYEYTCLSDKQKKTFDLSLLFQLKILPKLIKLICNDKYDKIVFHSYRFSHVIASIFSKMRGKKNVIRSVSYNLGKRSLFKRILRQIYYRFANLFIDEYWSIHELNEKFFLNFGVSSDKIFLVDHCSGEFENILKLNPSLLLNKTNFCKKYDLPINKKFLLFTGRFVERKNPLLLLEAFSEANLEDDWFLIMVGNGKFEKKLKENALKYKIKNLKFFNFQNQENLIGFLNNAEILILPSIAGETHGNIATEAMQFSCALILSNMVGLHPECLREQAGLVFEDNNKKDLINKITMITKNENLLKTLQSNAKNYSRFKTPKYTAELIANLNK